LKKALDGRIGEMQAKSDARDKKRRDFKTHAT
jgi:hypothetical protein